MKKIYKSLAVAAVALMANAAFGQNLVVTADGKPVKDGDIIELPYELEEDYIAEWDWTFYSAVWNPRLEASTKEGSASLTVSLTSIDAVGFQLCWPDGCQAADPGKSISSTGTINTTPQDLSIHKMQDLDSKDEIPASGGTIKLKLVCGAETMEITVNALLSEKAGVGENFAEYDAPTVYYTLEGIQVENPTKGIYVARKGGKAKLVRK